MRAAHILVGLVLVASSLLSAQGAQGADGETCQGKPATIVQSQGNVKGTDGDDVIVGGPDTRVRAGAGDDTICVAGGLVDGDDGRDIVEIRGTGGADIVLVKNVEQVDVKMRGGPDHVRVVGGSGSGVTGRIEGGAGVDVIVAASSDTVVLDLAARSLRFVDRKRAEVRGFENAAVWGWSPSVRLVGDAGDNRLWLTAFDDCGGIVRGGAGDDVISALDVNVHETCVGLTAYGERGDDVMRGSAYDDVLIGGPGRDRAFGGDDEGNDRCAAEVRRGCESR